MAPRATRVGRVFAIAAVTLGLGSVGLSVFDWITGAEEWRPGSHVDGILLGSATVANLAAMGVLGLLSRPMAYPISRARAVAGYSLMIAGVTLLVMRVLRG